MLLSTSGTVSRRGRFVNTFCAGTPLFEDQTLIMLEHDKTKIISNRNHSI